MRAYSRQLRVSVLAARDSGKSTSEVAKKFKVSEAWVRRVIQQRRELGKIGPYKYRFRNRNTTSLYQRARHMVMEDPSIRVKELERVLGTPLSIDFIQRLKFDLAVNRCAQWYGGLKTEFVRSPTGNYHTQPPGTVLPWDLQLELEKLLAGKPPSGEPVYLTDWFQYPSDTEKYPTI